MPIKLKIGITKGWKAHENQRFGEAIVMKFINTENDKVMFEYAPKLEDKDPFRILFVFLEEYDNKLKELKEIIQKIQMYKMQNEVLKC